MAKFRACYTGGKAIVADADGLVFEGVGEVIFPFGHCSHKDAYRLLRADGGDVVVDPDDFCVETEGDFSTVGREVVGDRVLDHFE